MFKIDAEDLTTSEDFMYLVRRIDYNNGDWVAVYQNLKKARKQ